MTINKTIEVRYYGPLAPAGPTSKWKVKLDIKDGETGEPVNKSVVEAHFRISKDERGYLDVPLGENHVWNDDEKTLFVYLPNDKLGFIRKDTELAFSWWVVWDDTSIETIWEGTVTAVRVD